MTTIAILHHHKEKAKQATVANNLKSKMAVSKP
jgi:hypothetical protein